MTDLRTAAQQALEAWDGGDTEWFKRAYSVMDALRAALAEEALRSDIIRMALEAGFGCDTDGHIFTDNHDGVCDEYLARFAALVAAAEREACAAICDTTPPHPFRPSIEAAHAIRARGQG